MSENIKKIAKLLRTEESVLFDLEKKMEQITGKSGIMEKVAEKNMMLINKIGSEEEAKREITALDQNLNTFLEDPQLSEMSDNCGKMCDVALGLKDSNKGFFLKEVKASEMLEKFPPESLIEHFGYTSVKELIEKEGLFNIFSALRFTQSKDWMHNFFDNAYSDLEATDFEERDVRIIVLDTKWLFVAKKFLEKKFHNVSHLKELGVIFVVPLEIDTKGETLRVFTLLLHYLNEVPFYSSLFRKLAREENFADGLKSLLRGDVAELDEAKNILSSNEADFLIIQRYLAKDDVNDPRLALPHINPEAEHWYKAESDLMKLSDLHSELGLNMNWSEYDFVGEADGDRVASYNFLDMLMNLVKGEDISKAYHQREAMWNKIFVDYLGRDEMNKMIDENILKGSVKI